MPFPSNGQNFVRPQSGGTGGWMAKLFGGIADDRRSRTEAQIKFDLHQAIAQVDTEHKLKRSVGEASARAAGKIEEAKGIAKNSTKTYKKFTDPKEEYIDKKGRKRTRGGLGIEVKDLAGFDSNYMPRFQAKGLQNRGGKTEGNAPVVTNVTDNSTPPNNGGNPPNPPSGGKASKPRNKKSGGAKNIASTNTKNPINKTETPSNNSGAAAVTPPKTRKPRTPKAGA